MELEPTQLEPTQLEPTQLEPTQLEPTRMASDESLAALAACASNVARDRNERTRTALREIALTLSAMLRHRQGRAGRGGRRVGPSAGWHSDRRS